MFSRSKQESLVCFVDGPTAEVNQLQFLSQFLSNGNATRSKTITEKKDDAKVWATFGFWPVVTL